MTAVTTTMECTDIESQKICKRQKEKGKCTKATIAANCQMTCELCSLPLTQSTISKTIMTTTQLITSTTKPEPTTSNKTISTTISISTPKTTTTIPTTTMKCEDMESKKYCNKQKEKGKCAKATVAAQCQKTCEECSMKIVTTIIPTKTTKASTIGW